MFYLVLLAAALVTWVVLRAVPKSTVLMRTGIAFVVAGALTTLVMWWMVIPELVLVAGVVMVAVAWFRSRTNTPRRTAT